MNMFQAVKTCFSQYATTSGRASRAEYWWWFAFLFLTTIVLVFIEGDLLGWEPLLGPTLVFIIATILPTGAVTARRLHDTNWSGWWAVPSAVTMPGSLFAVAFGEEALFSFLGPATIPYALAGLVHLAILVRMCFRSTPGTNRFGSNPAAPVDTELDTHDNDRTPPEQPPGATQ